MRTLTSRILPNDRGQKRGQPVDMRTLLWLLTANDFADDSCPLPFGEFSVNYGRNKLYNIRQ